MPEARLESHKSGFTGIIGMLSKSLKTFQVLLVSSLLISSSSVLAAAKNNQQLTNDLTAVQQGMGKIEKDMKKLQRLLDNRAMLELFQRMDELADEVSQLRGLLEQQNHDLAGLKKRQRELYLDTDGRLRELEITSSRSPAPSAPVVPAAPITAVPSTPAPKDSTGTIPPASVVTQPSTARPATIQSPSRSSVPVSEERAAYQKAFDMLKEGRYKMANASFREFLTRFPQSSYSGNAQYWLGESNYVTRQFEQAVKEFQAVLNKYPSSNKVPDAMLKMGYTYYELRQFDQAKAVLNQLRQNYPKGTAARLAGKRLDRMKKEGF